MWRFIAVEDQQWEIMNVQTGLFLTYHAPKVQLTAEKWTGDNQRFFIIDVGNGHVTFNVKYTNYHLTVKDCATENNVAIGVEDWGGRPCQFWTLHNKL